MGFQYNLMVNFIDCSTGYNLQTELSWHFCVQCILEQARRIQSSGVSNMFQKEGLLTVVHNHPPFIM